MNRFKKSIIYKALAMAGVFGLSLGPAEGVLRGDGGDRPNIPVRSMTFKPYQIAAAMTLTEQDHAGRLGYFDIAAGVTVTLPRATGSGAVYRFRVKTTVTSVNDIIKVGNTDDQMIGNIYSTLVGTPTTVNGWQAVLASAFDTITMNGTTTGGISGDWIEVEDIAQGFFAVRGAVMQSGTGATLFTATV